MPAPTSCQCFAGGRLDARKVSGADALGRSGAAGATPCPDAADNAAALADPANCWPSPWPRAIKARKGPRGGVRGPRVGGDLKDARPRRHEPKVVCD